MKTSLFIAFLFLCIAAGAQNSTPANFAIFRTDYREGTFKVYYENGRFENLIDTLKLSQYLDKTGPINSKTESDRIFFKCLEYLNAKGYELVTFSMFPTDISSGLLPVTENKNFYREYIFRKRRN